MPNRVTEIKDDSKFVVFSDTQVYEPAYDSRDLGSYVTSITQRFFSSEPELKEFLNKNSTSLDSLRVYRIEHLPVSLEIKFSV